MPPKPKIKIKVKKLSKKQLEKKANASILDLEKTYSEFQAKFQNIINKCKEKIVNKDKIREDLFNTVHSISFLLSKAVPLELRNSPNDRSKQLKNLLNTWIKESSSKKDKGKSISYTSLIKSFIETSLTPEGTVRFSRTKKNSGSVYRALDVRNIINPTADDIQCDIAFGTNQWPATHKCYICGLCLHNMQSDNCGAPCEHLLNIYQVMITFGFIEIEDRIKFDINKNDKTNIYAPSCTCCNSEKSNIEIISFKDNKWQVNEKNVGKILNQVVNSKRECCYKNGHPEEPKDKKRDDQAIWVKPSTKDNDKCSNSVPFPGEKETRPLYDYSDDTINDRKTEIVKMLQKRVYNLNQKVPRPKATSNLSYLNAIIQIATFFTHISFNAYKKIAMEMAGRTLVGAPPAAGAGEDTEDSDYELCSDTDTDCCDTNDRDCFNIEFKKLFEIYFWNEFKNVVRNTDFIDTSTTDANINLLISTLSTNNTEIMNITTDDTKIVYDYLLKEDHRIQEEVEKDNQVLQARNFKNTMLDQLPKTEDSVETNKGSPAIEDSTSDATIGSPDTDTDSNEEPDDNKNLPIFNPYEYGLSSDSESFGTEDIQGDNSSESQLHGFSSGDDSLNNPDAAADAEVSDILEPNQKSQKTTPGSTPGSRTGTTPGRSRSQGSLRSTYDLGGKKTRKNKTRKQRQKKQSKRISYVKNKQTRKKSKNNKKSKTKKAT